MFPANTPHHPYNSIEPSLSPSKSEVPFAMSAYTSLLSAEIRLNPEQMGSDGSTMTTIITPYMDRSPIFDHFLAQFVLPPSFSLITQCHFLALLNMTQSDSSKYRVMIVSFISSYYSLFFCLSKYYNSAVLTVLSFSNFSCSKEHALHTPLCQSDSRPVTILD